MAKKNRKPSALSIISTDSDRKRIPPELIEKFGQFGFVKWTSAYCPVLIVDPMQMVKQKTLLDGIYHAWMYKLDLTRATAEGYENLPVLIYWYGTTCEFSVVALSKVVLYEEGAKLGYDKLPEFMSRRIDQEQSIPAVYQLCRDGLEELITKALHLAPEKRSSVILSPKRKSTAVLNEWHVLSMNPPPERQGWLEKRDKLLEILPNKEHFGKIGFLPFNKGGGKTGHYHPVLILSPFKVPPGTIRTEWFHKCSSRQMVLVYWFGAYVCGRQQSSGAYSFNFLSHVVSLEEGMEKGYDQLPAQVKKEYYGSTTGKRQFHADRNLAHLLSLTVDWQVCGQWELQQALAKEPEERWGGLEDFEEDHMDDFDYYWECIEATEQALQAKKEHEEKLRSQIGDQKAEDKKIESAVASSMGDQKAEDKKVESTVASKVESSVASSREDESAWKNQKRKRQKRHKQIARKIAQGEKAVHEETRDESAVVSDEHSEKNGQSGPQEQESPELKMGEKKKRPSEVAKVSKLSHDAKLVTKAKTAAKAPPSVFHQTDAEFPLSNGTNRQADLPMKARDDDSAAREDDEETVSEEEIDVQVRSSLAACAAVLRKEKTAKSNRRQERKRKAQVDERLPNHYNSLAKSSYSSDRLLELKRRKDETQEVVQRVIQEWTAKKARMGPK